jgi:hypothetical protein
MSSNLRQPPVDIGAFVRILTPYSAGPAMSADVQHVAGRIGTVLKEPDFEGDILVAVPGTGDTRPATYYVREWEPIEHPQPDPAVEDLQARVEALEAAAQAHADWKRTFVEAAHAVADEWGWGPEFDEFMEAHGLPGRGKDFEVHLEATVKVIVPVSGAQSEEDAFEQARDILRTFPGPALARKDSAVLSVENVAAYEV